MHNMTEHDPFTFKEKRLFRPIYLLLIVSAGLIYGIISLFFGENGDYQRIQIKLFIDGEAQNHMCINGSNLSHRTLKNINLRGSCFPGVNLENADLSGSDLQNAVFKSCNMKNINLDNANLQGAMLIGCHLEGANLKTANLTDADLQGSFLTSACLTDASLSNCNLDKVMLKNVSGLSTKALEKTRNWLTAVYDEKMAETIHNVLSQKGSMPDFQNWDTWLLKQQNTPLPGNDQL